MVGACAWDRDALEVDTTVEDWSQAPAGDVRDLLAQECARWQVDLGWNLARDWAAVAPAKQAGLVPGWIARDHAGQARGWAFGVLGGAGFQLAALVGREPSALRALVRSVSRAAGARGLSGFIRSDSTVRSALAATAAGRLQDFAYLVAAVTGRGDIDACQPVDTWRPDRCDEVVRLCAEAYGTDCSVRPFAPGGTPAEWADYLDALTQRPGCGLFSPQCSVLVGDPGHLVGAALVSVVGPTTAHLTQLVVAPEARGRGLGRRMIHIVMARVLTQARVPRLSLIVSTANAPARRLYAALGFRPAGSFVAIAPS